MKLNIKIGAETMTATLDDSEAARSFARLLPLTVQLTDYAATEKIADLPKRLETGNGPSGYQPASGDIAYYAPWGNLALFHKPFAYSEGLHRLGRFDQDVEILRRKGTVSATFERQP